MLLYCWEELFETAASVFLDEERELSERPELLRPEEELPESERDDPERLERLLPEEVFPEGSPLL